MSGSVTARDLGSRKEALLQFASIDLIELCQEAKVEHCRASRDLSTCGHYVQHALSSCGHAALCEECSQRCDVCPICRTPLPKGGKLRLRLYDKCIEAGIIARKDDVRSEQNYNGEHLDVQRLYSLFDVALENNLVPSICHYVTDVCLDENAVSSDPVLAFLLDEVVVKNWCRWKYKSVVQDLHDIYVREEGMQTNLNLLLKFSSRLNGISNVLAVLESSFAGSLSAELQDLHWLSENTLKTKQHLDVMIWCIRHKFLENVESRYPNSVSWNLHVSERKLAAIERTWPNLTGYTAETAMQNESTLFIEDALSNLQIEQDIGRTVSGELDVRSLLGDAYQLSDLSEMVGVSGLYPFKDLRSAADILFLHGTSDVAVAKQAIFLYYLFDRHWSTPDVNWRHIVDDFATSFNIHRRSVLESLVFYLLDDHSDEALHQASQLLPVIAGRDTHPKVAEVLLERQRPDLALMVLRCCGRDGFSAHSINHDGSLIVSLNVAVTAVRVRIECGLLTEAFIYQRMHCSQVKENKLRCGSYEVFSDGVEDGLGSWVRHLGVLVTEICSLCVRRNLVDRMIELPWNSDEELVLHKCLFDKACQQPSSINGSLLVVFYLQRCRYVEAYQIDDKLRSLEQNFFQTASEEEVSKIRSISQWREGLINKSIELLPEVQRVQLKSGNSIAIKSLTATDVGFTHEEPPNSSNSLVDSSLRASFVLHADNTSVMSKTSGYVHKEVSSAGSFDTNAPRGQNKQNLVSRGSSVVPGPDASGKYSSYPPNGGPPGPNGFSPAEAVHKDGESQQYPFGDLSIQRSIGSPVTPFEWKLTRSSALGARFQDENATGLAEKATFSFLRRASVQEHPSEVDAIHKSAVSYNSYADNISASSVKGYQPGQFAPSVSLEQEKKTNAFWRSDERETPKATNTNGVPRWRSDDSSEDEDKSESFMGSRMSSLKRRSKHGRI